MHSGTAPVGCRGSFQGVRAGHAGCSLRSIEMGAAPAAHQSLAGCQPCSLGTVGTSLSSHASKPTPIRCHRASCPCTAAPVAGVDAAACRAALREVELAGAVLVHSGKLLQPQPGPGPAGKTAGETLRAAAAGLEVEGPKNQAQHT